MVAESGEPMKNKKDTSFILSLFCRDMELMTYHAIPHGSDIELSGGLSKYYGFSPALDLRTAIDRAILETFTETKSRQELFVIQEDGDMHLLLASRKNLKSFCQIEDYVYHARIELSVLDFGVNRNVAKRSIRLLKNNHNGPDDQNPDSADWVKWAADSDEMAERAGHYAFWAKLAKSEYTTNAYDAINTCSLKILGIKCCKAIEGKINDALLAFQENPHLRITIPTYSIDKMQAALDRFNNHEIDIESFYEIMYAADNDQNELW